MPDLVTVLWLASCVQLSQTFRALGTSSDFTEAMYLYFRQGVQVRSVYSYLGLYHQDQEECMSYSRLVSLVFCSYCLMTSVSFYQSPLENKIWGCLNTGLYSKEYLCIPAHHYWAHCRISTIAAWMTYPYLYNLSFSQSHCINLWNSWMRRLD